jgi:hypothetical protein
MSVDPTIGALGGVALGAVLSALLSYWQARQQRKWQVADFARTQSAVRDKEVRDRADLKAQEALTELQVLEELLVRGSRGTYVWPSAKDKRALDAKASLRRLSKAALYLQKPLRRHIELVVTILPDVDQLAAGSWVSDRPQVVANVLIGRARDMIGRYLRNEKLPVEWSSLQEDYRDGWNNLQARIEHMLETQEESHQLPDAE